MKWNCACGVENSEKSVNCAGCGWTREQNEDYKKTITETINPSQTPYASTSVAIDQKYKGVGGWLLLLCLGLTVFGPIMTIVNLGIGYSEYSAVFDRFPGIKRITIIDTLLSLGLMAFSIYAGMGLWSIRPGAVQMAKRYLLTFLGYLPISAVLPFMAGLPSAANNTMLAAVAPGIIKGVIGFIIWYSYLNNSKRVRATYVL
jgi:hypothetical protein